MKLNKLFHDCSTCGKPIEVPVTLSWGEVADDGNLDIVCTPDLGKVWKHYEKKHMKVKE